MSRWCRFHLRSLLFATAAAALALAPLGRAAQEYRQEQQALKQLLSENFSVSRTDLPWMTGLEFF